MTNVRRSLSVPAAAVYTVGALALWRLSHTGRAAADDPSTNRTRTQIKWLIHTGNFRGLWPPDPNRRCNDSARPPMPNSIARMQIINSGCTAVLVMPTGDGGNRCCDDGTPALFSLGAVDLKHGVNNLYPAIRPYPDWRAFVDVDATPPQPAAEEQQEQQQQQQQQQQQADDLSGRPNKRIMNAVDAFLDERGRLLWVLDTGDAGEDACYGADRRNGSSAPDADADDLQPPKFMAIDVLTDQIISVVSLARVWKPGVSCFQYIVAVYMNNEDQENAGCWPLVVMGDAGTNRLLVYSHDTDRFSEVMLPAENDDDDDDDNNNNNDCVGGMSHGSGGGEPGRGGGGSSWTAPLVRDILYMVPLFLRSGVTRLLVTYHGCRKMYIVQLLLTPGNEDGSAVVTGLVSVVGRKPCRMILLGTDRRHTDVGSATHQSNGGGTTVFFRLENTNDIWSWDTGSNGPTNGVEEYGFRLVRLARTCRIPVAVSAAPAAVVSEGSKEQQTVRQLMWMLETNFVDYFAGTADQMGANAKLQPLEMPADGSQPPPLRVQPAGGAWPTTQRPPSRCKRTAHSEQPCRNDRWRRRQRVC